MHVACGLESEGMYVCYHEGNVLLIDTAYVDYVVEQFELARSSSSVCGCVQACCTCMCVCSSMLCVCVFKRVVCTCVHSCVGYVCCVCVFMHFVCMCVHACDVCACVRCVCMRALCVCEFMLVCVNYFTI